VTGCRRALESNAVWNRGQNRGLCSPRSNCVAYDIEVLVTIYVDGQSLLA
jgi:hypothetical protein